MAIWSALVFLATCCCAVSQTGLSTLEKQQLLDLHNYYRSRVSPTATDMEIMIWNDELATVAQNYAEGCVFRHNPNRSALAPSFNYVGENLAITTSSRVNYTAMVELWYNEVIHYNYSTNKCGDVCGHYTQIVWADSNRVGCGAYRCPTTVDFNNYTNSLYLACNYGPGGNIRGVRPYLTGDAPCSACPQDLPNCTNNLCSAIENQAPTVGSPAPTVGSPAPTVGSPAPTVGSPAPTVESPAPTVGSPAPTVGSPAPTVGSPAPTVESPAPTVESPAPTIGSPAPTIGGDSGALPLFQQALLVIPLLMATCFANLI